MGLFLSRLFWWWVSGEPPMRILMVGLDNAGKTTILYKVKHNDTPVSIPTVGFNVETVSPVNGVTFTVWDVGGQKAIRQLWRHYYEGCKGLIYVVDSADPSRFSEAREELEAVCNDPLMAGVPVVVIANKQDLPDARKTSEVAEQLGLHGLKNRKWFVQGACVPTGQGIYEAMAEVARLSQDFRSGL